MRHKEKVIEFLNNNHGYITTAEFLTLGISKPLIQKFLYEGLIERVSYGLYMDNKRLKDDYFILQKKYPLAIFSYQTALYILNLTNRTPIQLDITVPRDKKVRGTYKVHRVSENYYKIGIIEVESPNGYPIRIYDVERCICDLLRTESKFDLELQNQVLDYYFHSKDKNLEKLLEYAEIFNIYEKVNTLVEGMVKGKKVRD